MAHFEVIEWLDHCTYSESRWRDPKEIEDLEPIKVLTLGWVIKETKDKLAVVSTVNTSGSVANEFLILKKAIVRRKKIRTPFKEWK